MFASLAEGILEIRTYNAVNKDMSGWGVLGNLMSVLNVKVSLLTANPSSFKLVPVDSEQFKMCPYWQNLSALKHHMIIVAKWRRFWLLMKISCWSDWSIPCSLLIIASKTLSLITSSSSRWFCLEYNYMDK